MSQNWEITNDQAAERLREAEKAAENEEWEKAAALGSIAAALATITLYTRMNAYFAGTRSERRHAR